MFNCLITNLHQPKSTLIMFISALTICREYVSGFSGNDFPQVPTMTSTTRRFCARPSSV